MIPISPLKTLSSVSLTRWRILSFLRKKISLKANWLAFSLGLSRSCIMVLRLLIPACPRYMGARICTSWAAIPLLIAAETILGTICGIWLALASKYDRSAFFSVKSVGSWPWRIWLAKVTIVESSDCLKILVRETLGKSSICKRSAKTWPGPTEGSWSWSPTMITWVVSEMLSKSWLANQVSTIENSSMIIKSQSR